MEIRKTYKFEYEEDGNTRHGISNGFLPDYATKTLEVIDVLYPAKGMDLKNKTNEKVSSYVILQEGDSMDNYEEIERENPLAKRRLKDAE